MVMSCEGIDGTQNYVFWFLGDLERRAKLREPATLLIMNATRSDTADYRCEVSAPNDQKSFDEILISLVVRGKQTLYLLIRYFYFLRFFFFKSIVSIYQLQRCNMRSGEPTHPLLAHIWGCLCPCLSCKGVFRAIWGNLWNCIWV